MRHTARQYAATFLAATEGKTHTQIDAILEQFLATLRKEKARKMLPAILKAFRTLGLEHAGQREADVTTARSHETATVHRALEKALNQKVTIQHRTDPSILGGIVVRIGDLLIDGSVRSRLETLRTKLQQARSLDSSSTKLRVARDIAEIH